MGCFASKQKGEARDNARRDKDPLDKLFAPPKWKSPEPLTQSQLERKREEFWDTAPHYGGDRVIWDALKAAVGSDTETAKLIIDSAGIVVGPPDLTICYDERGAKYELPKYVLSAPSNLTADDDAAAAPPVTAQGAPPQPAFHASHATQAELMGR